MLLIATILSLGFLSSVYVLFKKKRNEALIPTMYLSLLVALAPFMFTGWSQWYAFKFVAYCTLTASACVAILWRLKRNRYLGTFILILIVVGVISVPILRYASIPYLHPTTRELKAASFVHSYYEKKDPIYYTEYPPYIRVLMGKNPGWEFTQYLGFTLDIDLEKNNFLVVEKHLTRCGYYIYSEPIDVIFNRMKDSLASTHNLVYTSGTYPLLFIKESEEYR